MEKAEAPASTGKEPWWGQVTLAVGAVDEASKLTRSLFTYFLTVSAYVAIAVFGTTQEMLLLDAGIELPIIGTQVPVNAFFILAPIFIVAFHGNLLVKLWALKKKAETQAGHIADRFGGKDGEAVRAYRELLFPYDFTMIVAGPKGRPVMRGAMSLIVALTVFIGPLALLFLIMQKFAPAGINAMTLFHGAIIAVDAAALALFRAGLRRPEMLRPLIGTSLQVLAIEAVGVLGLSLALIRLSLWMEDPVVYKAETRTLGQALEARAVNPEDDGGRNEFSSAGSFTARLALPALNSDGFLCLVNPDVAPDLCPALRRGQLANDTVRPIADADLLAGQERLSDAVTQLCRAAGNRQLSLRERQLRGASLGGMVAPCVDFQGSDLTYAYLGSANLTYANLWRANLTYANLWRANLTYADLESANLTYADLESANLTAGTLEKSLLFSTDLRGGVMTGTSWGDDILHPGLMLAFVDRVCFAPLLLGENEDGERLATCDGRPVPLDELVGLDLPVDDLAVGDEVLESSPLPSNFDTFACVWDGGDQPIGTDRAPMSLKSCAHPDFRERLRWHYCGQMNRRGQQDLSVPYDYRTEPNPLIITAETCVDVGLGTDREREWLEEKFPDFDWRYVPR